MLISISGGNCGKSQKYLFFLKLDFSSFPREHFFGKRCLFYEQGGSFPEYWQVFFTKDLFLSKILYIILKMSTGNNYTT